VFALVGNLAPEDPEDELLMVHEPAEGPPMSAFGGGPFAAQAELWVVGRLGVPEGARSARLQLPPSIRGIVAVGLEDLDDNGLPELFLAHDALAPDATPGVLVLWDLTARLGDGTELSYAGTSALALERGEHPSALVALNADGDTTRELAVLLMRAPPSSTPRRAASNPAALGVADPGPSALQDQSLVRIIDARAPGHLEASEPLLVRAVPPLVQPQLASADVDQDGLADLIVGDGFNVYVHRGLSGQLQRQD
jgi:hypothetical protein